MDIYKNIYYDLNFEGSYKLVKIDENYVWDWDSWNENKDAQIWDISEDRFKLIKIKSGSEHYNMPGQFLFIEGDL